MLTHPTLDKLQTLRLTGMHQALVEQLQMPDIATLTFEARFGLLVDREGTERENRRDVLEIVEDRHDRWTTLITSQLPVERWHDALGDPTLADAILDRFQLRRKTPAVSRAQWPERGTSGAIGRRLHYDVSRLSSGQVENHFEETLHQLCSGLSCGGICAHMGVQFHVSVLIGQG